MFKEMLEGIIATKRVARDAINWEDTPEAFLAFEKRALFGSGWIQGAEWTLNLLKQVNQEKDIIEKEIADVEEELKREQQS